MTSDGTTQTTEYWFARRFPVGNPRNNLAPVSRKALRVVGVFVAGMVLGGLMFLLLGLSGQFVVGAIIFALLAGASGGYFITKAASMGDKSHTVADYKAGRVPGQLPYMS
ncbi:MAG: hypothetical protein JWR75_273 [Devosia sp.]|nr:hypothetical protein [Devosia sp.]